MIYSKLCHIIWKNPELYKFIVILICGFYQLRVKQILICKLSSCIGVKEWCIDFGLIAPASAAKAMEGHHYYRWVYLHKECFDALIQFRFQRVKI